MRVMLDNSVLGHSQFAEVSSIITTVGRQSCYLAGFVRKKEHEDVAYQREMDALFTVGRLIRESQIQAFSYVELTFESWKRPIEERAFDALADCLIRDCDAPLERSRFFQSDQFSDYVSKGGKKDRKSGKDTSMSQIRFVEWLLGRNVEHVQALISSKGILKMSSFEVDSLYNLPWFRTMCQVAQSQENYPDMLHVWTAQRNRMDVFLTLEKRLPNIAAGFPAKTACRASFEMRVLRPLEMLSRLGISQPDSVPIRSGWFYPVVGGPFLLGEKGA